MGQKVLYLGDTALDQAASYLAGVLAHEQIAFDYVDSATPFPDNKLSDEIGAVVISDYPSANFSPPQLEKIIERTAGGMGLMMVGGWESFVGLDGGYNNSALAEALPVTMSDSDDRVNGSAPCVIRQEIDHPLIEGTPFKQYPPCIAGYNRLGAKAGAEVVLAVDKYRISETGDGLAFSSQRVDPLLVAGDCGKGRVLAYAGDGAPHWAGGFVDWGDRRVTLQAPGAGEVEVGNWYIQFFSNLVNWLLKK